MLRDVSAAGSSTGLCDGDAAGRAGTGDELAWGAAAVLESASIVTMGLSIARGDEVN